MSESLDARLAARRQAEVVSSLRRLARSPASGNGAGAATLNDASTAAAALEHCDLCGKQLDPDHRHLLHLVDRRILCACESCVAMRGGDPELRPTGTRTVWLDDFTLDDEVWASFGIPIGLAFFIDSSATGAVSALYPSPAGATESELYLEAWNELVAANPILADLAPEVEALVVNRLVDPHGFAIVPIDRCYELVGMIKATWEGISGGDVVHLELRRDPARGDGLGLAAHAALLLGGRRAKNASTAFCTASPPGRRACARPRRAGAAPPGGPCRRPAGSAPRR